MNQLIFHSMSLGDCNVQSINQLTGTVDCALVMNELTGNWEKSAGQSGG
jgi:hypothetical protein